MRKQLGEYTSPPDAVGSVKALPVSLELCPSRIGALGAAIYTYEETRQPLRGRDLYFNDEVRIAGQIKMGRLPYHPDYLRESQ